MKNEEAGVGRKDQKVNCKKDGQGEPRVLKVYKCALLNKIIDGVSYLDKCVFKTDKNEGRTGEINGEK